MITQKKSESILKAIFVACLILFTISGGLFAQKIWNLEDCINYAFENNISVKQSYLDVELKEINQLETKLGMLPNLNASASHYLGWGRSIDLATYEFADQQTQQTYFDISTSVTLFNGFQKINTMKQQRYDYLASKYNSDKIKNNIAISVAGAYLQILFSSELTNSARNQVEVSRQQVERTQKLVEAGTLAQGSLLEIQAQLATEEVSLIQAENQLNLAMLDLLQLLELEAGTDMQIEIPNLDITKITEILPVEYIYNVALDSKPEIKSAEMDYESSKYALAIARGSRSPSLSLRGNFGSSYSDQITDMTTGKLKSFDDQLRDNRNTTLTFNLSIPIFNGYQASSNIKRSKLSVINADYNLQLAKNTLRKNIETSYTDALASYKTYVAREKSLKSLQESFNYTDQKFNVGMVNAIDYNVAKNQMIKAESELLSAKFDYIFKLKLLDFYLEKPLTLKDLKISE